MTPAATARLLTHVRCPACGEPLPVPLRLRYAPTTVALDLSATHTRIAAHRTQEAPVADTEPTGTDWRSDSHNLALSSALGWAQQAEAEYRQAVQHEDAIRARAGMTTYHAREASSDDRREAQFHGTRSLEAARLAEMWASIADVLQPRPPAPATVDKARP